MVINYDVSSWEKWEMHATLFDFFHSDSLQSTYFLTMKWEHFSIGIIIFIGSEILKMESVTKNTIFGLKIMVKSGLEKNILKSLHAGRLLFLLLNL